MLFKFRVIILGSLLALFCTALPQTRPDIQKLKDKLSSSDMSDSARVSCLTELAEYYSWTDTNMTLAADYIAQASQLCEKNNIRRSYKLVWLNGELLNWQGKYLAAYYEIITIKTGPKPPITPYEGIRFDLFLALILKKIGALYDSRGLYEHFLNPEIPKTDSVKLIALIELGRLCVPLNDKNAAIKYFNDAQELAKKLNDLKSLADCYNGLGSAAVMKDINYPEALKYYKLGLDCAVKIRDSSRIMNLLRRKAWYEYTCGNKETAVADYNYLILLGQKLNNREILANAYGNLCGIFRERKDYNKAIEYFNLGTAIAMPERDWYHLSAMYDEMSRICEEQGNYAEAYKYCRLYKNYSDSSRSSRLNSGYADSRVRYETDKKEKELENLSNTLTLHKKFMYALAASLVLVLLVGLLLYRQFRMNARRKLSEMNHQLSEITQKNLRQQMNPHFIFNTLNSIQYYMYQHDTLSTNTYLTKFSRLIRRILENSEQTSVPVKDELDALQLYLELEQLRFKDKFEYSITVDENIDTLDYKIPTMFIQPLVENAVCHGLMHRESGGKLDIKMTLKDDFIECSIEDNGIGREAAREIKRRKDSSRQSLGTKITQARLDVVNTLYGKNMSIEYTDLKQPDGTAAGTKVVINIPVMT